MSDEHKARALLDLIREPHMHDAAFAHVVAALAAAETRGLIAGLREARGFAERHVHLPRLIENESGRFMSYARTDVHKIAAALDARLATLSAEKETT